MKKKNISRLSKQKGYLGEIQVRNILRPLYPKVERSGSATGFRTKAASDLVGLPYGAQVKRRARTALGSLWVEVEAGLGKTARLFHRDDRSPWLVTLRLDEYVKLEEAVRASVRLSRIKKGLCPTCKLKVP